MKINISLLSFLGRCTTATYKKSNGLCGCAFNFARGQDWKSAVNSCNGLGARLPEISDDRENADIFKIMVYYFLCILKYNWTLFDKA